MEPSFRKMITCICKCTGEQARVNATDGGINETKLFSAHVDMDASTELVTSKVEEAILKRGGASRDENRPTT
jgi:hypothetical protein